MEEQQRAKDGIDDCSDELHPQAVVGLKLFNEGQYFACHEALELAWREDTGPIRDLYRGILQVAVAYLHIQRGNYLGAIKMFKRCRPWLEPFPNICRGINVEKLKRDYQAVQVTIIRLGPTRISDFDPAFIKPVEWQPVSPRKPGLET